MARVLFILGLLGLLCAQVDAFVVHHPAARSRLARRQAVNATVPARFMLLHYNDVHAHYDEFNRYFTDCTESDRNGSYGCYGGVARQKTVIDRLRREAEAANVPLALIDAGDQFQGTLYYTYWKQFGMNITSQIMNRLGVDTFTLGNHEFDDGVAGLVPMLKDLKAKVVGANVKTTDPELDAVLDSYAIVKAAGGAQIGVVGATTPSTPSISSPGQNVKFEDVATNVQTAIDELKGKGVKCVIVASHIGYDEDQKLAAAISGAQIIIGGHSHSLLLNNKSAGLSDTVAGDYPTVVKGKDGKDVYIVTALWGGKYLGVLDVAVDENCVPTKVSGSPILLDKSVTPDAELDKLVKEWRIPFDLISAQGVANLTADVFRGDCMNKTCPLGSMVAECMRNAASVPRGSVAIVNRGGIRVDLKAGVLTRGQIMAMLPFGNSLVAVNFTGKQLLDTLEVTASAPNTTNDWFDPPRVVPNAFSQVAGVRFAYDPKKDYGKKVVGAEYQATDGTWSAIVADKVYPIVTIDFLATGGDGLLKPPPALNGTQIILLTKLDDEVTQCWMKAGTVVPIVDDRICNLGESSSCSWLKTNTTSKPNGAAALGLPKALGALAVAAMFALLL